jgi:hypothetical protein
VDNIDCRQDRHSVCNLGRGLSNLIPGENLLKIPGMGLDGPVVRAYFSKMAFGVFIDVWVLFLYVAYYGFFNTKCPSLTSALDQVRSKKLHL